MLRGVALLAPFAKTRIYSLPTGASLGSYRRRSLRLKRPQNGTRQVVKAIVGTSTQGDGMKDLRREIP